MPDRELDTLGILGSWQQRKGERKKKWGEKEGKEERREGEERKNSGGEDVYNFT